MTLRRLVTLSLAAMVALPLSLTAQDDFDFDALLQEITDEGSAPAAQSAAAPAEEPTASDDPFADLLGAPPPPATPASSSEEPAEEDPFADLMGSTAPAAPADEPSAPSTDDAFASLMAEVEEVEAEIVTSQPAEVNSEPESFEDLLGSPEAEPPSAEVLEQGGMEVSRRADDGQQSREQMLSELLGIPLSEAADILAKQEEVRRQAAEEDARRSMQEAYQDLEEEEYGAAISKFEEALKMPVREKNRDDADRAGWGYAEAAFNLADKLFDNYRATRNREKLLDAAEWLEKGLAKASDHSPSVALYEKVQKELQKPERPVPVQETEEFADKQDRIDELIREGKEYYYVGDYDKAESLFESVLLEDEYNVDAMRLLTRVYEGKYNSATKEREKTEREMLYEVRDAWNPPVRTIDIPGRISGGPTASGAQEGKATRSLEKKLDSIIIPTLDYREANIADVVADLVDHSIAGDPEGEGVNIIINLKRESTGEDAAESAPAAGGFGADPFAANAGFGADPFASNAGFAGDTGFGGSVMSVPTITLNLRRVSIHNAIKYITEVAGLKFRIEEEAVIITPTDVAQGQVFTRMYPVQPSFIDVIFERDDTVAAGGGGGFGEFGGGGGFGEPVAMQRGDVREFFENIGVKFPDGTSITYNSSLSKLIVTHTEETHDQIDRILEELNQVPYQVEIEAKFVEVNQTELEELGLEWLLTDDWEIARNSAGLGGIAGQERLQVDRNSGSGGFTGGNRYFTQVQESSGSTVSPLAAGLRSASDVALGSIFSFSSVLSNPEMSVVLHALDQSGNSDLLSAPKVTTRTGQPAIIQVVEEIIYPTEFESEVGTLDTDVVDPDGSTRRVSTTVITVTPGAFETRPVGVILNVTPTVGPDGYTINLDLAPEVAELVDWIDYGTSYGDTIYPMPQPVFSSRNVTTSISIWDGQTVVMGGLIREDLTSIDDRIPLLGDLPLIGRLFRTEGERSVKKNLVMFVTARLVKPDGRPLNTGSSIGSDAGSSMESSLLK